MCSVRQKPFCLPACTSIADEGGKPGDRPVPSPEPPKPQPEPVYKGLAG